jgi:hypothetical protein
VNYLNKKDLQTWYGQQMFLIVGDAIRAKNENDDNIDVKEMAKRLAERKVIMAKLQLLKDIRGTFQLKPYKPLDFELNCPVCKRPLTEDC